MLNCVQVQVLSPAPKRKAADKAAFPDKRQERKVSCINRFAIKRNALTLTYFIYWLRVSRVRHTNAVQRLVTRTNKYPPATSGDIFVCSAYPATIKRSQLYQARVPDWQIAPLCRKSIIPECTKSQVLSIGYSGGKTI